MIDCCVANAVALLVPIASSSRIVVTVAPVPTLNESVTWTIPLEFALNSKLVFETFVEIILSVIVILSAVKLATSNVPGTIVIPPDLSAAVAVVVPSTNLSADSSHIIPALSPVPPPS